MRGVKAVVFSVLICASVGVATVALAQGYPPPTPTPTPTATPTNSPTATPTRTPKIDGCDQTGVVKKGKFHSQTTFHRGENIAIRGKKKCAKDNIAVKASIDEGGTWIALGTTTSTDKGSYTIKGKIPAGISLGEHTIRVKAGNRTYTATITVVAGTASAPSGFTGTAGPLAAAWVALFGIAAAFFVGSRRRRRPVAMVATDLVGDVPMLDTSHFVPEVARLHALGPKAKRRAKTKKKPAAKKARPATSTKSPAKKPDAAKPAEEQKPPSTEAQSKGKANGGRATTKRSAPSSPGRGRFSEQERPTPRPKKDTSEE